MHSKARKNTFARKNYHVGKRNNHERAKKAKTPSEKLDMLLDEVNLHDECINCQEINENCSFESLIDYMLESYGDDLIGNENLFEYIIPNVKKVMNFQIQSFTMTIIRTNKAIYTNLDKFRKNFMIERLFRIRDVGQEKCYVVISRLKLFWVTASLDNFISVPKKLKLIDGKKSGNLIWAWLKNFIAYLTTITERRLRVQN